MFSWWRGRKVQSPQVATDIPDGSEWAITSEAMSLEGDYRRKFADMLDAQYVEIMHERGTRLVTPEIVSTAWHRLMEWRLPIIRDELERKDAK